MVEISLHGAGAATHERQTQVAGSFGRLLTNLEQMQVLGLRVQLNSTLTAWNETEMEAMSALAERMALPLRWNVQITPRDNGDRAPLDIAASPQAISRLRELLEQRRGTETTIDLDPPPRGQILRRGCVGLTVDPWGNVSLCAVAGSGGQPAHRENVRDIWERSPVLQSVRVRTEALAATVKARTAEAMKEWFCPALMETGSGEERLFRFDISDLFRKDSP